MTWPGPCLALDWGQARIGVAACDREGLLAYPVETVPGNIKAMDRLVQLVEEYQPVIVFIGLPVSLRGRDEIAASKVRGHAERFASLVGCEVRMIDERMTTVTASRQLHEVGRSARQQRAVIDQAAATAILQHAIEAAKQQGALPGSVLSLSAGDTRSAQEETS